MPTRRDLVAEAGSSGRRALNVVGTELREARLVAGLSQRTVAARLGTSQRHVGRVEFGTLQDVGIVAISRHAAVLGLRLHVALYPHGSPLRDQAQLAVIGRFRARISPAWHVRGEAPLPLPGDLRAWDLLLTSGTVSVGVEAVTRLRDVQALFRAVRHKQRDGQVTRVVIVVPPTATNRRALAALDGPSLGLRLGTRSVMAALAAGQDPGQDAIVVI